jgi:CHAT domain
VKLIILFRSSLLLGALAALMLVLMLATNASWAQSSRQVCASPERATTQAAMFRLFKYHEDAIVEMGRKRGGVPLPMFDRNDPTSISEYINRYVAARDDSAFMMFAADGKHICSYLFSQGSSQPIYQRQAISGSDIQLANGELRRAILCKHIGSARASRVKRDGSLIAWFVAATDAATNCQSLANGAASVKFLSQIFFPDEFQRVLQSVKHVAILPIRSLSAVPVAVLEPLGDGRQTVELFSINFVAFLPDIRDVPSKQGSVFSKPLIVGDPDGSLPGALKEADELHKVVGGRLLRQSEAMASSFVDAARDADLIYIAAHGLSEFENSMDKSFIVLTDDKLTARQVQELKLKGSPLVVLSACQTGLGTIVEAGIIGIGRAFQKAGARSTVMSLWSVFDDPTFYMMTEFRKQIGQNTPAEALRLAMLAGKKKYPEPVNWSGFMVLGN